MKHVIKFSESTSYKFDVNEYLANYYYIKSTKDFIRDLYRGRCYIYLNQIYENIDEYTDEVAKKDLDIVYAQKNENLLFRCVDGNWNFDIDIEELEDKSGYNFVIDIYD